MSKKVPYSDVLDGESQVEAEEEIAGYLYEEGIEGEERAAKMGREILYMVLRRFCPDCFIKQ